MGRLPPEGPLQECLKIPTDFKKRVEKKIRAKDKERKKRVEKKNGTNQEMKWFKLSEGEGEKRAGMNGGGKTGKMSTTLTHKHCTLFRWTSQGQSETLSYT